MLQLLSDPDRRHLIEDLRILASELPEEDDGFFPALLQKYILVRHLSTH